MGINLSGQKTILRTFLHYISRKKLHPLKGCFRQGKAASKKIHYFKKLLHNYQLFTLTDHSSQTQHDLQKLNY